MIINVDAKHGCAFAEGYIETFVDDLADRLLAGDELYNPIGQAEIILGLRILVRIGKLPPLQFRDVHTGATVDVLKDGQLQDWPAWLPGDLWDRQLCALLS